MNAIEDKIENLKNIIKRNGDRITKPRLAVYEFLVSNQGILAPNKFIML